MFVFRCEFKKLSKCIDPVPTSCSFWIVATPGGCSQAREVPPIFKYSLVDTSIMRVLKHMVHATKNVLR